ncbi:MAG: phenylalanine--tRNA ligase subunit alpha [Christensenellaceae bacterium]|jgi:phenylalanyl-tRNA synthetase alpha chain|nr:phenylalanine--tRNA ligase subunit alpha [Christensenellaceae bacterium]
MYNIEFIEEECIADVNSCKNSQDINAIRVKYLGKNGKLTTVLKSLKDIPPSERPEAGRYINDARIRIENKINTVESIIAMSEKEKRILEEQLDVTLSKKSNRQGGLNPISIIINDLIDIFLSLGFGVEDGPEIEFEYFNFSALNIPSDHPSRDSSDTFYISKNRLLRTQTSAVQVHVMKLQEPPIRIICPGKVYRPDDDATHSPMFHQIEGLLIDRNISLYDLKEILEAFAKAFFSPKTKIRFRPSYFPFTEPSVEVDLSCPKCGGNGCKLCKNTGWLELLGAGIVHPLVLEECNIDIRYSGLAFGIGVERAAMVKFGIHDMRLLFDNDIRILRQFR